MILKKTPPRHEVISIRLNEDRLQLLERYRRTLADQLGREVSLAEATFLALEDRAVSIDRATSRQELLREPTESLVRIRQQWASYHALSAAEWDVVAEYVKMATERELQEPPLLMPAVPSRESYLALLDAFDAVYQHRTEHASRHTWAYFGNLGGFFTSATLADADAEQRHQAVMAQIADRRTRLQPTDAWERPHNIGHCFWLAIREEGVDSTMLDHLLAPYWPTLWGLAARGSWIRHDHKPVRVASPHDDDDVRRHISVPSAMTAGDLTLSFVSSGDLEFTSSIDFGPRRFSVLVGRYPELVEFRAMLEAEADRPWTGKYFSTTLGKGDPAMRRSLWLKPREVRVDLSEHEWRTLRDLARQTWKSPDLQRWLLELRQEYGEQG